MAAAIEVERLSRSFAMRQGPVQALSEVTFTVAEGSVAAVLGVNGAGKTTLTKILATLLLPTSGSARIRGHDVARDPVSCRRISGVVFGGERGFYGRLSGRNNLRFFGMLAGVARRELKARVPVALEEVGLLDVADRPVETYSKGMRQRLHLGIGLLTHPKVLLLDEPTVGLDVIEAKRLREVVRGFRDSGTSILLTSHQLLDVAELADRVLLLERGEIARDLSVAEFAGFAKFAAAVIVTGRGEPADTGRLPEQLELGSVSHNGSEWTIRLRVRRWDPSIFTVLGEIFASADVVDVSVSEVRLEEAFTALLGSELEAAE